MKKHLTIFTGTSLQNRITNSLLPELKSFNVSVVSLRKYYKLFNKNENVSGAYEVKSIIKKPWYDRPPWLKIISLPIFFLFTIRYLIKSDIILLYVDTGILERFLIHVSALTKTKSVVLQDAIKRKPKGFSKTALSHFGGGKADIYLLLGEAFRKMVVKGKVLIVGSPVYGNRILNKQPGEKILILNQCFSRYGETSEAEEIDFIKLLIDNLKGISPIEIRLHPHNNPTKYRLIKSKTISISWKDKKIEESFFDAGLVVGVNSTAIFEALCFNLPILHVGFHKSPFFSPFNQLPHQCKTISDVVEKSYQWKNGMIQPLKLTKLSYNINKYMRYSQRKSILKIIGALENIKNI